MKKRILSLIMIAILILSCSCKKAVEETTADAEELNVNAEQSQQQSSENESKASENEQEPQQSPENELADKKNITTEQGDEKEPLDELYNYEVTEEPFESMKVYSAQANYFLYASEQEMFDDSHLVIVGMPLETFTEGDERYFTATGFEVEKGESGIVHYCTVRNVKVLEVLKGDKELETVKIANDAVVKDEADGSKAIMGLDGGDIITKKNVKYIYYLKKSESGKYDFYYAAPYSGVVNIDGLDRNSRLSKGGSQYEATKARAAEFFTKYDRSAELVKK